MQTTMNWYSVPDKLGDFANRNPYARLGIFPAEFNSQILKQRRSAVLALLQEKDWQWGNYAELAAITLRSAERPYHVGLDRTRLDTALREEYGGSIVLFRSLEEIAKFMDIQPDAVRSSFNPFVEIGISRYGMVGGYGSSISVDIITKKRMQRWPIAQIEEDVQRNYSSVLFGVCRREDTIEELSDPPKPEETLLNSLFSPSLSVPVIGFPGEKTEKLRNMKVSGFASDDGDDWPSNFRHIATISATLYREISNA